MSADLPWFRHRLILPWVAVFCAACVLVATSSAQGQPSLTIVEPANGATVDGPVTVRVQHSGIRFDGTVIGQDPSPGVGHWHVNVDGKFAGLAVSDVLEIPNDHFPTISAGEHTITVNLHENNHALTDPPVEQSIKLTFAKEVSLPVKTDGPPTLKLVAPGDGVSVDRPLVVRVEHSGIRFDGTVIGQDPSPGVGHYHINVDGKYAGLAVSNVIEIPNDAVPTLSAGQHTIMLNLHENNHAVTNPPVEHSFQINVTRAVTAPGAQAAPGAPQAQGAPGATATAGMGHLPNTGVADSHLAWLFLIALALLGGGWLASNGRPGRRGSNR